MTLCQSAVWSDKIYRH